MTSEVDVPTGLLSCLCCYGPCNLNLKGWELLSAINFCPILAFCCVANHIWWAKV